MTCNYVLYLFALIASSVSAEVPDSSLVKVALLQAPDYGYVVEYPNKNSIYVVYQQDDKSGKYFKQMFTFDGKAFARVESAKLKDSEFQRESDKVSKRVYDFINTVQKNKDQQGIISTHQLRDSHNRSIVAVVSANEGKDDQFHSFLKVMVGNINVGVYEFIEDEAVEDVKTVTVGGDDYLLVLSDGCGADVCNSYLRVLKY